MEGGAASRWLPPEGAVASPAPSPPEAPLPPPGGRERSSAAARALAVTGLCLGLLVLFVQIGAVLVIDGLELITVVFKGWPLVLLAFFAAMSGLALGIAALAQRGGRPTSGVAGLAVALGIVNLSVLTLVVLALALLVGPWALAGE